MKTTLFILLAFCILTSASYAQSSTTVSQDKSETLRSVEIKVPTIQCNNCVRTVEKALTKLDGVESAEVDLETKVATVQFHPGKLDLAMLEKAITNSGYNANDKPADPEAYEKLDECCKLP